MPSMSVCGVSDYLEAISHFTRPRTHQGMNAVFPYRGLPGEGEGRWGNTSWPDTISFLDRCAEIVDRDHRPFDSHGYVPWRFWMLAHSSRRPTVRWNIVGTDDGSSSRSRAK